MRSIRHSLLLGTIAVLIPAWEANAQVPVADAAGAPSPAAQQSGQNNQVLVNLYLQLEALQREVQNLRGLVEEQAYQIQRMESEQRDRYIDLDRRLSNLTNGRNTGPDTPSTTPQGRNGADNDNVSFEAPQGAGQAGENAGPGIPTTITAPGPQGVTPANEQELYRTALNLLLEESDYEQSIRLFQQYIDDYPGGEYITNAFYWQGEALILVSRYNQAKDAFMKIVNDFPNDPKAPGAMLKLGVVYSRMGDSRLATQVWQDIQVQYPQSLTEIRAAEDYLRRATN